MARTLHTQEAVRPALINKRRDVAFEVSVIMRSINRNKILDQGEYQQKCRTALPSACVLLFTVRLFF